MLPSIGKVLPIRLLHSCCPQLDCLGRGSSQPRGVWRNRLCFHLQVKYYLYSSSILVALNWIAEAEDHPSPEECGGIDYASIYWYYTASVFCFFWKIVLKGQCHEISWISFPQAPEYTIRVVLNFFKQFVEMFAAQGSPPVPLTPVANGKNLQSEECLLFYLDTFG
jgi:hypothetical protein